MTAQWLTDEEIIEAENATGLKIEDIHLRLRKRLRTMSLRIKDYGLNRDINRVIAVETIRLFNLMEWKCAYCGVKLDLSITTKDTITSNKLTIDHITPLTRNGIHRISNVTCCCYKCNNKKGGLTVELFFDDDQKKIEKFYSRIDGAMEIYKTLPEVYKE